MNRNQRAIMKFFVFGFVMTAIISVGIADEYQIDFDSAPAIQFVDRWVYPFNISPGTRIQAPTFGAVGSEGFDDKDGQYLLAVNTQAVGIPVGNAPTSYSVDSVRLKLTESVGGYRFDGTYDGFTSYLEPGTEMYQPDLDPGRPIELFGVGFRNGFQSLGFPDGGTVTDVPIFSAGSPFGPTDRGTRNVFAADATGRDVSNNVDSLNQGMDGFDPTPFAIGQAFDNDISLPEGLEVAAGTAFVFDVDISNPAILHYVQQGLSVGQLGFVITSMHRTGVMGAGEPFVNLATANHFATSGPVFEIQVTVSDSLSGDFDNDGILTALDIDELAIQITNGSPDTRYDLNKDSSVDREDHRFWVENSFGTFYGDANLDGEFNSNDFVSVFAAGQYEDAILANSTWATGDWNGDREFDTNDFVLAFQSGSYEQGPRAALSVAEPSTPIFALICLIFAVRPRWRFMPSK